MQRSTFHTSSHSQVRLRGTLDDRSKIFKPCEFYTLHMLFFVEIYFLFFLNWKKTKNAVVGVRLPREEIFSTISF